MVAAPPPAGVGGMKMGKYVCSTKPCKPNTPHRRIPPKHKGEIYIYIYIKEWNKERTSQHTTTSAITSIGPLRLAGKIHALRTRTAGGQRTRHKNRHVARCARSILLVRRLSEPGLEGENERDPGIVVLVEGWDRGTCQHRSTHHPIIL